MGADFSDIKVPCTTGWLTQTAGRGGRSRQINRMTNPRTDIYVTSAISKHSISSGGSTGQPHGSWPHQLCLVANWRAQQYWETAPMSAVAIFSCGPARVLQRHRADGCGAGGKRDGGRVCWGAGPQIAQEAGELGMCSPGRQADARAAGEATVQSPLVAGRALAAPRDEGNPPPRVHWFSIHLIWTTPA